MVSPRKVAPKHGTEQIPQGVALPTPVAKVRRTPHDGCDEPDKVYFDLDGDDHGRRPVAGRSSAMPGAGLTSSAGVALSSKPVRPRRYRLWRYVAAGLAGAVIVASAGLLSAVRSRAPRNVTVSSEPVAASIATPTAIASEVPTAAVGEVSPVESASAPLPAAETTAPRSAPASSRIVSAASSGQARSQTPRDAKLPPSLGEFKTQFGGPPLRSVAPSATATLSANRPSAGY
jgi:hypothetical protein